MGDMKLTYRVVNNTIFIAEGSLDVEGEAVVFRRTARKVELVPESNMDTSGTVLFVAAGAQNMAEAAQWGIGDLVELTVAKIVE